MAVDWARVREEYERSTLDWPRLFRYAERVARELADRDPHSRSWQLDSRYWKRVDRTPSYVETMRNAISYQLGRDGSLIVEITSWSEMMNPVYWETPKTTTNSPFDEDSVAMFDFEPRHYSARDGSVETNRDRSEKLLVHAKGVGLSKRLKQLLQR